MPNRLCRDHYLFACKGDDLAMKKTNPAIDLARDSWDAYDSWGSAIGLAFDICEAMTRHRIPVPSEWDYHPSPFVVPGAPLREDSSLYEMELEELIIQGLPPEQLTKAGEVFTRLTRIYDAMGLSY